MGPQEVLHLYRNILKAAAYFPSMKRAKIIVGIKEEFHANRVITEPKKVEQCLAVAQRGLADLQSYLPERTNSGDNISITLRGATTE